MLLALEIISTSPKKRLYNLCACRNFELHLLLIHLNDQPLMQLLLIYLGVHPEIATARPSALSSLCLAMKNIRLSIAIDLFHTSGAIPNAYLKKES